MSKAKDKRKDRKERKTASARKQSEAHKGGLRLTTFHVPDQVQLWKPAKKKIVDLIPYVASNHPYVDAGELTYERTFYVHAKVGPDEESRICPKYTHGGEGRCPICEYRTKLGKDPDADEEMVKALKHKRRQLFLPYDHDDEEQGVQLWEYSHWNFGKHLEAYIEDSDEDEGYDIFHDPDDGFTLRLGFSQETYGSNKYFESSSIRMLERKKAQIKKVHELLEHGISLDDLLIIPSYDELYALFNDEPVKKDKKKKDKKKDKKKKDKDDDVPF